MIGIGLFLVGVVWIVCLRRDPAIEAIKAAYLDDKDRP